MPAPADVSSILSSFIRVQRRTFELATAYATRMQPHEAFSHLTAAILHGMRVPERNTTLLHIGAIAPHRAPRVDGTRGHELLRTTSLVTLPNGLRVTAPVATWCSLGTQLTIDELVIAGDGLVRRQRPLATVDELHRAVAASAGRPGVHALRQALRDIRPNTDSSEETRLRLLLVRAGFPEPEVNSEIVNEYGAVIAHGDLVYRKQKVVLEYDGGHHRTDEAQFNIDIDRLDEIMELDFRVIRVNKLLMARHATLFDKLRTALTRHDP